MQRDVLPRSIATQELGLVELLDCFFCSNEVLHLRYFPFSPSSCTPSSGYLDTLKVSSALSIVKFDDLIYSVTEHAKNPHLCLPLTVEYFSDASLMLINRFFLPHYAEPNYCLQPYCVGGVQEPFPPITPLNILFKSSEGCGMPRSGGNDISSSVSFI